MAGCTKAKDEPPPPSFPKPIEIIDDDAPVVAPAPAETAGRASPEFECAAGAAPEQNLVEAEAASTRDEDGHMVTVHSYNGEGLTAFGLPVSYVQRFDDGAGWRGVGAYVSSTEANVAGLIQSRFPNTRTVDGRMVGDGMANPITLQATDQGVLYIKCAPAQ